MVCRFLSSDGTFSVWHTYSLHSVIWSLFEFYRNHPISKYYCGFNLNLDPTCYDSWETLKRLAAYRLGVDHITSSFHIVWGIWAVKLSIVVSTSRLIWIWCHPVWLHPSLYYRLILTQLFWKVCMWSRQTSIRISIHGGNNVNRFPSNDTQSLFQKYYQFTFCVFDVSMQSLPWTRIALRLFYF